MSPVFKKWDPEKGAYDEENYENSSFWDATPSGHLEMYITNPQAHGFFREGEECYVDFTRAEAS